MKFKFLLLLWLTMSCSAKSNGQNRIKIVIPTAEDESRYVWRTIQDIKILEGFNYTISLPSGVLIDSLVAKSKSNRLVPEDYGQLVSYMKSQVYNASDYSNGAKKIEQQRALVNKLVNCLSKTKRDWNFKEFDTYSVNLTLYGTGGSYHPDDGSIVIFTTVDGKFKQYENPANTLMHEIVHIGMEESIIQKLNVSHPLKERIVDKMVLLNFKKQLPEYRVQGMGDKRIDGHLVKKRDLKQLDKIVAHFLETH